MRVFVTGGTGFVGAHLVQALLERGDEVTCLVRNTQKAEALEWGRRVRIVRGDLDGAAALREGCRDAEIVYHVAGAIKARDATAFMGLNRDTTANVLEAAQEHPPQRFVYVSSQAVGGPSPRGRPIDESQPPNPVTSYGRSKLAGEILVRAMPFTWTIVRPPVVYGEWDRETLKIFRLAKFGVIPVFGDGSQELSVIHGADLARALIAAGTTAQTAGRLYYAAHPETTTSGGLVRAIAKAVGRTARVVPIPGPVARGALWAIGGLARLAGHATVLSADKADEFLAPAWTCRSDALTRDTGWRAEVPLEQGLARTAAWYRRQGWI